LIVSIQCTLSSGFLKFIHFLLFAVVTKRIFEEMERFKAQKLVDLKQLLIEYVNVQIEHSAKVEDEWKSILPELAAVDTAYAAPAPSS
jgi:hypothetical protein